MYRQLIKHVLDLAAAMLGLVLLSPVMALWALLIRATMGPPVLFRQERPGLHGKPFTLYKFRTMTDARSAEGELLPDADRITPLGRFLRSTSLDELPELWNVLRGEMSFVGPRPLLLSYLDRYTPEQARRHLVLPGITGWAQINGRNALEWEKRLAMDVWYADHCSFWLDTRILAMTFLKVISREGVCEDGEFMGVLQTEEVS